MGLLRAATRRSVARLSWQQDLFIHPAKPSRTSDHSRFSGDDNWYSLGNSYTASLSSLDVVLVERPPFDMEFFYATQLEDAGQRHSILNRFESLRNCNEIVALNFLSAAAAFGIRDQVALKQFHRPPVTSSTNRSMVSLANPYSGERERPQPKCDT